MKIQTENLHLGQKPYLETWQAMREYTQKRDAKTPDQLWFVEHPPVYTQGLAGKSEYLYNPGNIPVIPIDRGGQITYHGPGQAVIYILLDLKRLKLNIRPLVSHIENTTIATLKALGIQSHARPDAPGVYLEDGRKIASLGLKVSRGCTYHGVAINVDMDLSPFDGIAPCGLIGMKMAQIKEHCTIHPLALSQLWAEHFQNT